MTQYLISFDDGAMTFPEEELPDVAKAAHEVVQEAQDACVWVFGGGVKGHDVSVAATNGMVTDGPYPGTKEHIGGFRGRRRALTRGGAGVGCQDRRCLPLCARGTRAPSRPDRLIEGDPPRQSKYWLAARFTHASLCIDLNWDAGPDPCYH